MNNINSVNKVVFIPKNKNISLNIETDSDESLAPSVSVSGAQPFNPQSIQNPAVPSINATGELVKKVLSESSYSSELKKYFFDQQEALSAAMAALAKVQSFKDLPEDTRRDFVKQMNNNGVSITADDLENKGLNGAYRSVLEAEYNLLGNVLGKKMAQNISYDEAKADRSKHYKTLLEIVNKNSDLGVYLQGIAENPKTLPETLGKLGQEIFDKFKACGLNTIVNFNHALTSILLDSQHQKQLIDEILKQSTDTNSKQLGEWLEKIIDKKPANYGQIETQTDNNNDESAEKSNTLENPSKLED